MHRLSGILTLLIALFMLCTLFASCADNGDNPGDTGASTAKADTASPANGDTAASETDISGGRADVDDGIAAADYSGEKFRVYAQQRFAQYSFVKDYTGEVINDAIYERNARVSSRFGIELVYKFGSEEAMCVDFMNTVTSGSDEYDLFMGHQLYSAKIFNSGVYEDWNKTGIDFSQPWFPSYITNEVEVNKRIYLTISDICLSAAARSTAIFYNMKIADDYAIGNLYDIVKSGGWTIDKLYEISKSVYLDLDSSGSRTSGDLYGAICEKSNSYIAGYIYSLEMDNVVISATGSVTSNFGSEKNLDSIEKLCALFNDTEGGYMQESFANNVAYFTNGLALFQHGVLEWGDTYYRGGCEFDYGILPYPKLSETQEVYYSFPGGATSVIALPKTVKAERFPIVRDLVTALSAETWKSVLPLYTELTLKSKMARDEQSVEMIELVLGGRVFDFAGMYDGFSGYSYKLYTVMQNRGNLASYIKTTNKLITKHYQTIADVFYK